MATNLSGISQTEFEAAKAISKELLASGNSTLDLRDGTALSDLLIGPGAQLTAYNDKNIEDLRVQMSFKLMQANPSLATPEAMDNLAANYNIVRRQGSQASGSALITVSSGQEYTVPSGYVLTIGNLRYLTVQAWTLINGVITDPLIQIQLQLDASNNYYFTLPMQAEYAGSTYNATAGTSMIIIQGGIPNIQSAVVYAAFGGGTNTETNDQFIARIPVAMSQSEFSSIDSITARLMNQFPNIYDVAVLGMGDEEMLRDKHNIFGGSFGGRVDVYLKSFRQPYTKVIVKTATKVSDRVYTFSLNSSDAPGYYCIRSITSPSSTMTAETDFQTPAIGSFPFTEARSGYQVGNTFHDFSPESTQQTIETGYSVWQASTIVVTDVPSVVTAGVASYPDKLDLKVELYMPDQLMEIQAYIDSKAVINKESDTVAKSALLAFVTVTANVYRKATVVLDMPAMTQAVADYINSKTFGETLTTSQLSSVMHQFNIIRVDLDNSSAGMRLEASVRGTDGLWRTMSGSDLDVNNIKDARAEVTANTVIFVADPRSIFLTERVA